MRLIGDWIWPRLEALPAAEVGQEAEKRKLDLATIREADLADDLDVLIEEARRLTDAEAERRKSAETRATTYLAIVGVLAPILAAVAPTAVATGTGAGRSIVSLIFFLAAGAYLLGCGGWAFRALRVTAGARLDAVDLIGIWTKASPEAALARGLLACVRYNRAPTNDKVSAINMAHLFGVRAFVVFIAAMVVRSAWDPVASLLKIVF